VETFCEHTWSEIGASADDIKPRELPHRYIWKAHQTHLYTLEEPLGGFFEENLASAVNGKCCLALKVTVRLLSQSVRFGTCQLEDMPRLSVFLTVRMYKKVWFPELTYLSRLRALFAFTRLAATLSIP
jgi:hypothetical protein